ncbi:MAG TPA: PIN domain-containing protein [Anaerolineae bacterium]
MSGRFLLDTNVVIALLEGEAVVKDQFAQAEEVFVSSIALGELYFGAGKSGRPQTNRARVDEFATDNVVLGCDTDTARRYGEVKNALRLKGRPVPEKCTATLPDHSVSAYHSTWACPPEIVGAYLQILQDLGEPVCFSHRPALDECKIGSTESS